jgi:hypothetical protein
MRPSGVMAAFDAAWFSLALHMGVDNLRIPGEHSRRIRRNSTATPASAFGEITPMAQAKQKRDNEYYLERLRIEHPEVHADFQADRFRNLTEAT